jgi:hypothetical protein
MRGIWSRLFGRECEHQHVLVVTSVGVRRSICEDCGHISFTFGEMIKAPEPVSDLEGEALPRAGGF